MYVIHVLFIIKILNHLRKINLNVNKNISIDSMREIHTTNVGTRILNEPDFLLMNGWHYEVKETRKYANWNILGKG